MAIRRVLVLLVSLFCLTCLTAVPAVAQAGLEITSFTLDVQHLSLIHI